MTWGPWTDSDGKSIIFLDNLELGILERIESIYFEGSCTVEAQELSFKTAQLGSEQLAYSRARILEKDALVVASNRKLTITTEPGK